MKEFVVESGNEEGLFCFFEDDGDTGYLYLYEPDGGGIIDHLHIYSNSQTLDVDQTDVQVLWSKDKMKCGVKIWNKFYGIFDLGLNKKISISVRSRKTPPIRNLELLQGFDDQ